MAGRHRWATAPASQSAQSVRRSTGSFLELIQRNAAGKRMAILSSMSGAAMRAFDNAARPR
jgi:hypothetical protein